MEDRRFYYGEDKDEETFDSVFKAFRQNEIKARYPNRDKARKA